MVNNPIPFHILPPVITITGAEVIPMDQGGTTKRGTAYQVATSALVGFPATIEYVVDGGNSAIPVGVKGYLEVPFNATITQATMLADRVGSITMDVWKCTESQFDAGITAPTSANSITGTAQPTITAGTKYQDGNLTGWTISLSSGDILAYNVISASAVQRVTLSLKLSRNLTSS